MDLRTIDILYLHGPHRPARKEHMDALISNNDLKGCAFIGVSNEGSKSAAAGLVKLMKSRLEGEFKPFIFMEDDCSATPWFRHVVPVPEDADALYLGISVWGMNGERAIPFVKKEAVSDDIVRVFNMLSTHAVLIMSKRWVENVLRCYEYAYNHMAKPQEFDVPVAHSMFEYNVYALKKPLFYQDAAMGGQEEPTLIQF
jgi:hypothetical protein